MDSYVNLNMFIVPTELTYLVYFSPSTTPAHVLLIIFFSKSLKWRKRMFTLFCPPTTDLFAYLWQCGSQPSTPHLLTDHFYNCALYVSLWCKYTLFVSAPCWWPIPHQQHLCYDYRTHVCYQTYVSSYWHQRHTLYSVTIAIHEH